MSMAYIVAAVFKIDYFIAGIGPSLGSSVVLLTYNEDAVRQEVHEGVRVIDISCCDTHIYANVVDLFS